MKRKIWPYGMALTAGILLAAGTVGTKADAAAIKDAAITIDYGNQKLTVKEAAGQDAEIFFATATAKLVKSTGKKVITPSAWDIYDYDTANGVTIDLSFLNRAKENYIQIKGNQNTDPVTIRIPAVLSKVSASFNAADATVSMTDIRDKKNPVTLAGTMEYRTAYSNWKTYADDNLSIYQKRGAKLYFRLKAHDNQALSELKAAGTDFVDKDNQQLKVYEADTFPGVEKLVTVAKEASAPKVTVDYVKRLFTLPKNAEYRLITPSQTSSWTPMNNDKAAVKLNLSVLLPLMKAGETHAALEVRIAATSAKPASKYQLIEFDVPEKISVFSGEDDAPVTTTGDDLLANNFFDNHVGTCIDDMTVRTGCVYQKATKKITGIQFDNDSPIAYEIYVARAGEGAPASDVAKVYTMKAKPASSKKETVLTIGVSALKEGDKLYIRRKANAKEKIWSSDFTGLGTVRFDAMKEFIDSHY